MRPQLPAEADAIILKALSFNPKERYQRARELGDELAQALSVEAKTLDMKTSDISATQPAPLGKSYVPSTSQPNQTRQPLALEVAHVLFIDIVGYSKLMIDEQTERLQELQDVVRNTAEFQQAQERDVLIRLPTGDGMALVFFGDPEAPVRCALEICRDLRNHPEIALRMGVNSGPVYRVADINTNLNVAGGGINIAQRVMDCGDAGHILLSKRVADDLGQLRQWSGSLHDLGETEVKHGVRVHVFNLCKEGLGNKELPQKFLAAQPYKLSAAAEKSQPDKKKLRWLVVASITIAVLLALAIVAVRFGPSSEVNRKRDIAVSESGGATAPSQRRISYWLMVQKYRNRKPFEEPFRLSGEINFEKDYRVRLFVTSPQPGYLYIVNESPKKNNGLPEYNLLFPTPTTYHGASELMSDQPVQIPESRWFVFDQEAGTEKLWLIWSGQSLPTFEEIAKANVSST